MKYLYVLIVPPLLMMLSCAHVQYKHERSSLPRSSFVEIVTTVSTNSCSDEGCEVNAEKSVSSGSIIRVDLDGVYIIGANHVCEIKNQESVGIVRVIFKVMGISGKAYEAYILTTDSENDLCAMYVPGMGGTAIELRDHPPEYGEKAYNLASPRGTAYVPKTVPVFMGYYSGRDGRWDVYTIPAAGGSSGSPIVDVDGRLIGIIQASLRGFNHLTISSNYYKIKKMVDDISSGKMSMRINK